MSMKGSGTRLPMRGKEEEAIALAGSSKGRAVAQVQPSTPNVTSSSKSTQKKAALGRHKNDRSFPVEIETAKSATTAGDQEEC